MISVIMLTYNREALVSRAIESILAQTYRNFEFIIVDNGSSDRSGMVADEYAAMDGRVRVIHRERGNIGAGRNTGLDAAKGDYIAFIDDDDYAEPTYLEHLIRLAEEHRADIAVCGSWRDVDGAKEAKYVFNGVYTYDAENAVKEMLKREKFNSANPTKLIAARVFGNLRYREAGKYDDIELIYKVFASAKKTVVSGVPLYSFVRHADNNSVGTAKNETIPTRQVEAYLSAFAERTRWLTGRFPQSADFWLYTELSYALSMYDKVDDSALKTRLRELLRHNAAAFATSKQFYTVRDTLLTEKYGGEVF